MSDKVGINHDTAARLICITPGELNSLVRDGHIRRNDTNSYALPVLVADYIAYLKNTKDRAETHPKQADTAAHLDLSDRSVREWEEKLDLKGKPYSLTEIRIAYIRALREIAAGRAADGDLDLATERAGLAKAQKEKVEMQNAVTRGELAPAVLIEEVLKKAGAKIAGQFDAIGGLLRRRFPELSSEQIGLITGEIAKIRKVVAAISLDNLLETDVPSVDDESIEEA